MHAYGAGFRPTGSPALNVARFFSRYVFGQIPFFGHFLPLAIVIQFPHKFSDELNNDILKGNWESSVRI